MSLEYVLEVTTLLSIALVVILPGVAINRQLDQAPKETPDAARQRTSREVDELYDWYVSQFDREGATSIGAAYARFSSRHQESVVDQLRKILERAIQLGVFIPREHIFFDLAVSGKKKRRSDFISLELLLRQKKVKTLLLFATNRLFRKIYRTLEFVDRVHKSWRIRCVFIASGVDTNNKDQWEALLTFNAMMDHFVVTMYSNHIRAGHEGAFERRHVFGTISYGYFGEIIPGEFTPKGKPRRRLMIDPETARVVILIFEMFVHKRLGYSEIARLLNDDPNIMLPPGCRTGRWNDDTIRAILKNTRYRGLWRYGVTVSEFLPEEDYVRQTPRVEPLKEAQIEELRIVSNELWFAAAELMAQNGHGYGGRKPKDGDTRSRPRVLNGRYQCEVHQRPLVVSGANGRHMDCPVCRCFPRSKRPLVSWLNRAVAFKMVCDTLAQLILNDNDIVEHAIAACRRAAEEHQRPNPTVEIRLRASLEKVKSAITFTFKNPGDTEDDQAASLKVLRDLRMQRARLESELHTLQNARKSRPKVPSRKEVQTLLKDLAGILTGARQSSDPAERAALHCLFEELIDGDIHMTQQGERSKQKGWLRGTFHMKLLSTIVNRVSEGVVNCGDDCVEVSIDFKRPLKTDEKADKAWAMHLEKKRNAEIAAELGCCKPYVTKLLKLGAERHGVEWTDGRSNRLNFPPENRKPALFKQIADNVMEKLDANILIGEIAVLCGVSVCIVRKAIRWWHEQRHRPVPNGRTRAGRLRREANRGKSAD